MREAEQNTEALASFNAHLQAEVRDLRQLNASLLANNTSLLANNKSLLSSNTSLQEKLVSLLADSPDLRRVLSREGAE